MQRNHEEEDWATHGIHVVNAEINCRTSRVKGGISSYQAYYGKKLKNTAKYMMGDLIKKAETETGVKAAVDLISNNPDGGVDDATIIEAIKSGDAAHARAEQDAAEENADREEASSAQMNSARNSMDSHAPPISNTRTGNEDVLEITATQNASVAPARAAPSASVEPMETSPEESANIVDRLVAPKDVSAIDDAYDHGAASDAANAALVAEAVLGKDPENKNLRRKATLARGKADRLAEQNRKNQAEMTSCPTCQRMVGPVHKCPSCHKNVHPPPCSEIIPGVEEGFGTPFMCKPCCETKQPSTSQGVAVGEAKRPQSPIPLSPGAKRKKDREAAQELDSSPHRAALRNTIALAQEKQAEQINRKRGTLTKENLEVGDICNIKVEGNIRAATDQPNIPVMVTAVICAPTKASRYAVATKDGYLKQKYYRQDLLHFPNLTKEIMGIDVDKEGFKRELTVQSASAMFNVLGGSAFCGCIKNDCRTSSRCICKQLGRLCSSKCHKGRGNNLKCTMCIKD